VHLIIVTLDGLCFQLSGKVLDFLHFSKLFLLVGKDFWRSTGRTIGGVLILTVICSDKATNEVSDRLTLC
jgi:hypothetical protein